jgi:hypothetical protein
MIFIFSIIKKQIRSAELLEGLIFDPSHKKDYQISTYKTKFGFSKS